MLVAPAVARGGQVPKSEYLRYVPLRAQKIVSQTEASAELHLYGNPSDPGYRDVEPRDGVDDARMRRLQALGVRFAPVLVRNTPLFPMDFKAFWKGPAFPLYVDSWDISRADAQLVREQQVDFAHLAGNPCPVGGAPSNDDCRLLELLKHYYPPAPQGPELTSTMVDPARELFQVLYFDAPGDSEASWKRIYWPRGKEAERREFAGTQRVFTHPLIAEVRGQQAALLGYELALQYWLYYPVNDGGNNHEGDWEHVNVIVTPLSRLGQALSAAEIESMLSQPRPLDGSDPLVIARAEYYFHQEVYLMDFARPNAYQPRADWEREIASLGQAVEGERWIWKRIRQRAFRDAAETEINTHPIGFIGGDGLGLAQLTTAPGGKDQDSHGSYPFVGQYRNVGPTAAGERVTHEFDFKAYLSGGPRPRNVEDYASVERVEIVPDWERVAELVFEDADVRRQWAWLLLPIRFGYPAMESPGAGIIGHADTGNLAVFGPSYNPGWNRLGDCNTFHLYEPHKLSWAVPLGVIDNFQAKAGFLNAPIALGLTLPPIDLAWRVLALPVRAVIGDRHPVFTPARRLPQRTMSLEAGVTVMPGEPDFSLLFTNADQLVEIALRLALFTDATEIVAINPVAETGSAAYYTIAFHLGERFTTENTLANAHSVVGWDVLTAGAGSIPVRADLNLWEYQGVLRFNLSRSSFKPYVKLGYGLTWYRLENASFNGDPMVASDSPWIRKPGFWNNLWPNTLVTGGGIDWIGARFGGVSTGLKSSYTLSRHRIGFEDYAAADLSTGFAKALAGQRYYMWRQEFTFQLSLSF